MANSPHLLKSNGGTIELSIDWARRVLKNLGFSLRKSTTDKQIPSPRFYLETKLQFQYAIHSSVNAHNIPISLVINADQTPLSYVSTGNYTFDRRGTREVPVVGSKDKRMITATFTVTANGTFLPMQLIYSGKTNRSQPLGFKFPDSFDVTQNEKHWSNEKTVLTWIDKILIPYITDERRRLTSPNQFALLIFDSFQGHLTEQVNSKLQNNKISVVIVPANMTNKFQPLDVSVNKSAKNFIKKQFSSYYTSEVHRQLQAGIAPHDIKVDLRISLLKPKHAVWVVDLYNKFQSERGAYIIKNGFRRSGITEALSMVQFPHQDPFTG